LIFSYHTSHCIPQGTEQLQPAKASRLQSFPAFRAESGGFSHHRIAGRAVKMAALIKIIQCFPGELGAAIFAEAILRSAGAAAGAADL